MQKSEWTAVMEHGLSAKQVGDRLRDTSDGIDQSKRVLAFFLCEMKERRLHEATGHRDTAHFAKTQLDMDARRYRELVNAGEKLQALQMIDRAFCAGKLAWSRVLLLLRVVQTHTQGTWVPFAIRSTFEELQDEVANCSSGDLPGEGDGYGLKPRMRHLRMSVTEKTEQLLEHLRTQLSEDEFCPTDNELLQELAELAMKQLGTEFPPPPPPPRRNSAADRNDDPIPLDTRNAVLHRDHHSCRNCNSRYDVEVHHIKDRAAGGTNDSYNLLSLCNACHANLHHDHLVLVGVDANKPLSFTSADGTPIHRHRGGTPPLELALLRPPQQQNPPHPHPFV